MVASPPQDVIMKLYDVTNPSKDITVEGIPRHLGLDSSYLDDHHSLEQKNVTPVQTDEIWLHDTKECVPGSTPEGKENIPRGLQYLSCMTM